MTYKLCDLTPEMREKFPYHGKPYSKYLKSNGLPDAPVTVQCPECDLKHLLSERLCKEVTSLGKSLKTEWKHGFQDDISLANVCPRCGCSWYFTGAKQRNWSKIVFKRYPWDEKS